MKNFNEFGGSTRVHLNETEEVHSKAVDPVAVAKDREEYKSTLEAELQRAQNNLSAASPEDKEGAAEEVQRIHTELERFTSFAENNNSQGEQSHSSAP